MALLNDPHNYLITRQDRYKAEMYGWMKGVRKGDFIRLREGLFVVEHIRYYPKPEDMFSASIKVVPESQATTMTKPPTKESLGDKVWGFLERLIESTFYRKKPNK